MNRINMTEAAAAYFERVAGEWDALRGGYFTEALRDAAISQAYLRPDAVVADVGSGTGFMAAGLAPRVAQVIALDGSRAMLDVARSNLAAFDNVTYRVADGASLPLVDGAVDAVFANMVLHHCPDPAGAIGEMARLLRPGGRLVITDMDRHDHTWMREEMADEWLGFERSEVRSLLREAGLVNVRTDCADLHCCATSQQDASAAAEIGVFVAVGTQRVAGARDAVRANYGRVAETPGCGCSAPAAGGALLPVDFETDIKLTVSCCEITPASASCCDNAMPLVSGGAGLDTVIWDTGYSAGQLASVPAEAAAIPLGCGNPGAFAKLVSGERVLDIGSGGGIDAFLAARQVGSTGHVIGVDMTPQMIERARRAAAEGGLANVEFRLGGAEALPVEDGTIDVILSNCVINLTEDKGRVFEEAYRVLAPGGRLAVSDVVSAGPLPSASLADAAAWAGCVSGALPEQEYLDLVRAAGFIDVRGMRTLSAGEMAGVPVYSLSVSARKPPGG
jgi:ubiquinone/menaquinone biosynthesis C-methylase UbiE